MYNIFIPLISQATKCKISISNFKYENPGVGFVSLQKIVEKECKLILLINQCYIVSLILK